MQKEFSALPYTPEEIQEVLEYLASLGIAFKGEDGRYRLCEDVEVKMLPDGAVEVTKRKPQ
jgi:hypothetical protein